MMQIDETDIQSVKEGMTQLKKIEHDLEVKRAEGRAQSYKQKYIGQWIKIFPRDCLTYEPETDSTEFSIIKVEDIESVRELSSYQDEIKFTCKEGTYLHIDDSFNDFIGDQSHNHGRIQELGSYDSSVTAYSNCIQIIKPDDLNEYLELLKDKINMIIAAK